MRIFAALALPDEPRAALQAEIRRLKKLHEEDGRWSRTENLHLTLAFMGEADASAARRAAAAVAELPSIELAWTFSKLGAFGRAGILWAGLAEEKRICALSEDVRRRFDDIGQSYDKKPFQAHITLARDWRGPRPDALSSSLPKLRFEALPAKAQVFVSEREVSGRIRYRVLRSV